MTMGYFNELSMTPDSRPFSDEGWSVDDRKGSPLPEGCRIAHYSEAGWSYKTPTHTLWITDAPPCERCAGNHPITACQQPAPTPPAVTKEITYNRDNRDFDCYVTIDGQREYIGSAPTFHDGECQCYEYTIRFYADAHSTETAAQLIMEEVE